MSTPKLTVIIITYNQEKYIKAAIESVLNQKTDFSYELIVSDDCSTDKTAEIIKEYQAGHANIKPILNKENLGGSKNCFEAVRKAKGEYIVVFEGDDYWTADDKIDKQIKFLDENPEYFGVSHILEMRDDEGNSYGLTPSDERIVGKDATVDLFLKGVTFSCVATMYRNIFRDEEICNKYYSYITAHRMVADFSWCMTFLTNGRIKVFEDVMSVYRVSGVSVNATSYNQQTSAIKKMNDHIFIINQSKKFFKGQYNFARVELNYVFYSLLEQIIKRNIKATMEIFNSLSFKLKASTFFYFPLRLLKEVYLKLRRGRKRL